MLTIKMTTMLKLVIMITKTMGMATTIEGNFPFILDTCLAFVLIFS